MAIYRESRSPRRIVPIIALAAVAVIIVIALLVVLSLHNNSVSNPASIDSGLSVTAALDKISTSLDLFQIEYGKVSTGTAANQTGAPGAINTAINILNASVALSKLNKVAYSDLQTDLGTLNGVLHSLPPPDIQKVLSDTQKLLQTLRSASNPVTATPH